MVIAAEDYYTPVDGVATAAWALVTFGNIQQMETTIPSEVSDLLSVQAHVNEGRWSILCPWCPGSEYASRTDHRFICTHCHNTAVESKWVNVIWPPPDVVKAIEQILDLRRIDNQWWSPGETLAELIKENEEHGIETRL